DPTAAVSRPDAMGAVKWTVSPAMPRSAKAARTMKRSDIEGLCAPTCSAYSRSPMPFNSSSVAWWCATSPRAAFQLSLFVILLTPTLMRAPTHDRPLAGEQHEHACVFFWNSIEDRIHKRSVHKIEPIGLIWNFEGLAPRQNSA